MGQIAQLTNGGLPVADVLDGRSGVFLPDYPTAEGSYQTKHIWTAWSDAELNAAGYARMTEVLPDENQVSTGTSDDFTSGVVTRTHTTALKDIDELKAHEKRLIVDHRRKIAAGGIIFATKPLATDSHAMNDINLIFNAINAGEAFPGGRKLPWDTMDGEVHEITKGLYLSFCKAVAQHRIACTIAAGAHVAAIDALATAQEVVDYDFTVDIVGSEWPVNPVV